MDLESRNLGVAAEAAPKALTVMEGRGRRAVLGCLLRKSLYMFYFAKKHNNLCSAGFSLEALTQKQLSILLDNAPDEHLLELLGQDGSGVDVQAMSLTDAVCWFVYKEPHAREATADPPRHKSHSHASHRRRVTRMPTSRRSRPCPPRRPRALAFLSLNCCRKPRLAFRCSPGWGARSGWLLSR